MSYVKQNFVDGQVLNASKLNHMEDGIGDNSDDIDELKTTTEQLVTEKADKAKSFTVTIPASGWSGSEPSSCTVSVLGLSNLDKPIIDLIPSSDFETASEQIDAYGLIYKAVAGDDTLTVYGTDIPEVDLPINILCVNIGE